MIATTKLTHSDRPTEARSKKQLRVAIADAPVTPQHQRDRDSSNCAAIVQKRSRTAPTERERVSIDGVHCIDSALLDARCSAETSGKLIRSQRTDQHPSEETELAFIARVPGRCTGAGVTPERIIHRKSESVRSIQATELEIDRLIARWTLKHNAFLTNLAFKFLK